jgi:hypothetical protein
LERKKHTFLNALDLFKSPRDARSGDWAISAIHEIRKAVTDSSLADLRSNSDDVRYKWAPARDIQASRQAVHSSGIICALHGAPGNGAIGGSIVAGLEAILAEFL